MKTIHSLLLQLFSYFNLHFKAWLLSLLAYCLTTHHQAVKLKVKIKTLTCFELFFFFERFLDLPVIQTVTYEWCSLKGCKLLLSFWILICLLFTLWYISRQHTELLADLSLCEAQLRCQLGALWQGQVLRRLELPLQHCQLVAGVDGPGFAHLLWLPIDHPDLHVWLLFRYRRKTVEKPILQDHGNCFF